MFDNSARQNLKSVLDRGLRTPINSEPASFERRVRRCTREFNGALDRNQFRVVHGSIVRSIVHRSKAIASFPTPLQRFGGLRGRFGAQPGGIQNSRRMVWGDDGFELSKLFAVELGVAHTRSSTNDRLRRVFPNYSTVIWQDL